MSSMEKSVQHTYDPRLCYLTQSSVWVLYLQNIVIVTENCFFLFSIFRTFSRCGVTSFLLLRCVCPDITITKWHMPCVHQQLMCAMEETFCKKRGVKFANINLVSNWTLMFQLNELPFKCSRPWLHTFNPEVNLIWSQRAVQRHNPLIDKAKWRKMRVKEQKGEPSQWRRG